MPTVHIIPILRDNYCYVVEGIDKRCIIIDPGQVAPVTLFIADNKLVPELILNTHHHADHVAGNADLENLYRIPVIVPLTELKMIPHAHKGVREGDIIEQSGIMLHVIETPGHTLGHVVFFEPNIKALFSADTLFSMGCGRLMEGTADQMFASLQKIKTLPVDTQIYAGHEYTQSNGDFAASIEPDNADIAARRTEVSKLRLNNLPTLPVRLEAELKTNPFLRVEDAKKFAELRLRKDNF